jgi:hypothetical protein
MLSEVVTALHVAGHGKAKNYHDFQKCRVLNDRIDDILIRIINATVPVFKLPPLFTFLSNENVLQH